MGHDGVANIKCRVCLAKFQTEIHHLTEPIDVYCEWIDECEKVNATKNPEEEEFKNVDSEGDEDEPEPIHTKDENSEDEVIESKTQGLVKKELKTESKIEPKKEVFADEAEDDYE